ncbi:hypothetical protein DIPPA_33923 [Diplonema papillatum]|nr:hypothetical protein DIPPA_33923 [Diplonema papillatum]
MMVRLMCPWLGKPGPKHGAEHVSIPSTFLQSPHPLAVKHTHTTTQSPLHIELLTTSFLTMRVATRLLGSARRTSVLHRCLPLTGKRFASAGPQLSDVRHMTFKHHYDVQVRWGDMDSYNHVNNCAYTTYMETSRAQILTDINKGVDADFAILVAEIGIKYVGMVTFPDTVSCHSCVSHVTDDAFYVNTKGVTGAGATCFVSICKLVSFDLKAGKRRPIPDSVRAVLQGLHTD